jgi:hypothetical protein
MKPHEVREIYECLPRGKTPFHYFKDRYALWLLALYLDEGKRIHDVKQSKYSRVLQKPILRDVLRRCSSGIMRADDVLSVSALRPETFHLGLGMWGGRCNERDIWFQTSRPGKNLVLQLNFTSKHDAEHNRIIAENSLWHPLECRVHPIAKKGSRTLAWARCDVDLANGEALIEEIQNDWLRYAQSEKRRLDRAIHEKRTRYIQFFYRSSVRAIDLDRYFNDVLRPYRVIWSEAMLTAALWFLRVELGIPRIYYNTWDTGCRFKGIDRDDGPPRSLYSDLPRHFCFEETDEPPEFIRRYWARRLRTHPDRATFRWFRIDL